MTIKYRAIKAEAYDDRRTFIQVQTYRPDLEMWEAYDALLVPTEKANELVEAMNKVFYPGSPNTRCSIVNAKFAICGQHDGGSGVLHWHTDLEGAKLDLERIEIIGGEAKIYHVRDRNVEEEV
jgi:hypothetical protein